MRKYLFLAALVMAGMVMMPDKANADRFGLSLGFNISPGYVYNYDCGPGYYYRPYYRSYHRPYYGDYYPRYRHYYSAPSFRYYYYDRDYRHHGYRHHRHYRHYDRCR